MLHSEAFWSLAPEIGPDSGKKLYQRVHELSNEKEDPKPFGFGFVVWVRGFEPPAS